MFENLKHLIPSKFHSLLFERNPEELRYTDIFVAGGFPRHTYYPRDSLKLENNLKQIHHNLCKLVTVTGHTKSGKTVLVEQIIPRNTAVWVEGGSISNETDFWEIVLNQLDLYDTIVSGEGTTKSKNWSSSIRAEGGAVVAKGGIEAEKTHGSSSTISSTKSRTVTAKIAAIDGLKQKGTPLVIDDFHYIPKTIQEKIVRSLKQPIFAGLPVAIIAIPHHRYDVIKIEREMSGRVLQIQIPLWTEEELQYIPETGFSILNVEIDQNLVQRLAMQSIGSPHLMQDFCRSICRIKDIEKPVNNRTNVELLDGELEEIYIEMAESIGRPIFEKLVRGPRQRSDRKPRTLKTGEIVDIYGLVLYAMAHLKPELVSLEYEQLRTAIKDISADQIPTIQEVTRVLKKMSEIAANDKSSSPVIDYDEEERLLHITDPFFAFYLRWGKLGSDGSLN